MIWQKHYTTQHDLATKLATNLALKSSFSLFLDLSSIEKTDLLFKKTFSNPEKGNKPRMLS